jgi:hypothetical protein
MRIVCERFCDRFARACSLKAGIKYIAEGLANSTVIVRTSARVVGIVASRGS